MSKPHTILKLADQMPFGKYKGKTVRQVLNINPGYIAWWGRNVTSHAFALEIAPVYEATQHYCSPQMMARLYRGYAPVGGPDYDDGPDYGGYGVGFTDDDMRNDP